MEEPAAQGEQGHAWGPPYRSVLSSEMREKNQEFPPKYQRGRNQRYQQGLRPGKQNENFQLCTQQNQRPLETLYLNGSVTDLRIIPNPKKPTLREKQSRRQKERHPNQLSVCSNWRLRGSVWKFLNLPLSWQDFIFSQRRKWRFKR